MLVSKGSYTETDERLDFDIAAYAQINAASKKAWNKLSSSEKQTGELSHIKEGPDELFQFFVCRLMQAPSRVNWR